jgi:hypothetical protein
MASSNFLPNNGAHVIKANSFTKLNNLGSDWDYFVASVIYRSRELVSDIYTQPTSLVQDPMAFIPDQIQIVYIFFVGIVKPDLFPVSVIFQLPIWWRGNDEVNRLVGDFFHPPCVADYYFVTGLHLIIFSLLIVNFEVMKHQGFKNLSGFKILDYCLEYF